MDCTTTPSHAIAGLNFSRHAITCTLPNFILPELSSQSILLAIQLVCLSQITLNLSILYRHCYLSIFKIFKQYFYLNYPISDSTLQRKGSHFPLTFSFLNYKAVTHSLFKNNILVFSSLENMIQHSKFQECFQAFQPGSYPCGKIYQFYPKVYHSA